MDKEQIKTVQRLLLAVVSTINESIDTPDFEVKYAKELEQMLLICEPCSSLELARLLASLALAQKSVTDAIGIRSLRADILGSFLFMELERRGVPLADIVEVPEDYTFVVNSPQDIN